MSKENLVQMSIRIDPDTLKKINELNKRHTYWKRNAIINHLLTTLMNDFTDGQLWNMMRRPYYPRNEVRTCYEITDLLKDKKQ